MELLEGTRIALAEGQTNYPPSDGVPALREAVARACERELGLGYPADSVLVAGGARPLFLLRDQVCRTLTFGDATRHTPVGLVPEVAPYTVLGLRAMREEGLPVDAIAPPPGGRRPRRREPRQPSRSARSARQATGWQRFVGIVVQA